MKIFFTCLLLFLCLSTFAQQKTGTVSGRVVQSKDKKPLDYASIVIKNLKDSSTVASGTTSADGKFAFKNLQPGNYKVYAAFIGLKNNNKDFTITADRSDVALGDLILDGSAIDLQTVEIKAEVPPIVVKKDTLEFNASSFKTVENAVVEDLLKNFLVLK